MQVGDRPNRERIGLESLKQGNSAPETPILIAYDERETQVVVAREVQQETAQANLGSGIPIRALSEQGRMQHDIINPRADDGNLATRSCQKEELRDEAG